MARPCSASSGGCAWVTRCGPCAVHAADPAPHARRPPGGSPAQWRQILHAIVCNRPSPLHAVACKAAAGCWHRLHHPPGGVQPGTRLSGSQSRPPSRLSPPSSPSLPGWPRGRPLCFSTCGVPCAVWGEQRTAISQAPQPLAGALPNHLHGGTCGGPTQRTLQAHAPTHLRCILPNCQPPPTKPKPTNLPEPTVAGGGAPRVEPPTLVGAQGAAAVPA